MMLNKRLVQERKSKGVTRKDVAASIQIDQSTYGKYELGQRQPSLEILQCLSEYFNVSTDYLLGNSNDPTLRDTKSAPEMGTLERFKQDLIDYGFMKEDEDMTDEMLQFALSNLGSIVEQLKKK